jgi:AcrR family transcriptional regulator
MRSHGCNRASDMKTTSVDVTESESDERRCRGRPQARPDHETRTIIYDAARHEFAENGYAATSMETVARRAGVSTKTVYRLIATKAALFEGTVTARIDSFVSVVNLHSCEHRDIEQALQTALMVCADLVLNDEVVALYRMILVESDKFPEIGETFYQKAMRRTIAGLAEWLRTRCARGLIALDNVEEAAGMLLGMMVLEPQRATLFGHQPLPGRAALEARAQACAKLFLQGCRHG